MKHDKKSAAIFLFVLCVAASPAFGEQPLSPAEQALIQNMLENPKLTPEQKVQMRKTMEDHFRAQQVEFARRKQDAEAYWARMTPKLLAPSGPSPWLEKERSFYVDLLVLARPKILVIPPTVPEGAAGIDISGRVTIARELARLIEGADGPVPDPAMTYRAIGEQRTISVEEIRQKLDRFQPLPVKWLIVGTATHDGNGKMRITFSKFPYASALYGGVPPSAASAVFEQDGIEISEEHSPELAFASYASAAAKALGYSGTSADPTAAAKAPALKLPPSPAATSHAEGALEGIWTQELMGVLYDSYRYASQRPRERVFERSLAAALGIPSEAPDRNVLLARAMAYLDRRQAALAVLGKPSTPEEKALAAYLNSDLGSLRSAIAEIKRPLPRLISQLELIDLRYWAGSLPQHELEASVSALSKTTPPGWHPLLAYHILSLNLWTIPEPGSVKSVMDKDFRVPGYGLEELVRAKVALGARSLDEKTEVELALSPLVHAQKWRAMNVSELCCATGPATWASVRRDQYLDLLEADADHLAIQQLHFLSQTQGRPEDMVRRADLYDSVLFAGGHPSVVYQRLLAVYGRMKTGPREQAEKLGTDGFELSRSLLTWEPGQSLAQAAALLARDYFQGWWVRSQGSMPPGDNLMKVLPPHPAEKDFPVRVLWAADAASLRRGEDAFSWGRSACSGTILSFFPCSGYVDGLKAYKRFPDRDAAIKTLIEPRFHGYPARYEYLAAAKKEAGDTKTAEALLMQAVKLPSAPNSAYWLLGNLLLEDGQFAAASRVLLSYPGLKAGVENRVGVSNYASDAASVLARAGAMEQARPLFQIAAHNADGSQASLEGAARLALADGKIRESIFYRQRAYQAYRGEQNSAAIASILFAAERPDDAWNVIAAVVPQARQYLPYRAATVGMRMQSYDASAILKWQDEVKRRGGGLMGDYVAQDLIALAGIQMVFLDRDLSGFDALFETDPAGFMSWRSQQHHGDAINLVPMHFLPVYRAFRARDYQKAVDAWAPLLKSYDQAGFPDRLAGGPDAFWSTTPYYAFALAKAGKSEEARALLKRLTPEGRPPGGRPYPPGMMEFPMPEFEKKLIAGITAALAGDHAGAQRLLRGARGSMPVVGARLIPPDYAFAEILEALTRETGVKAYRDMALALARGREAYEPFTAWPYAFDAQYSPAGDAQVRATALALKLDPKSERLKKIAPAVVAKARAWLKKNDPFREKAEPPANQSKS